MSTAIDFSFRKRRLRPSVHPGGMIAISRWSRSNATIPPVLRHETIDPGRVAAASAFQLTPPLPSVRTGSRAGDRRESPAQDRNPGRHRQALQPRLRPGHRVHPQGAPHRGQNQPHSRRQPRIQRPDRRTPDRVEPEAVRQTLTTRPRGYPASCVANNAATRPRSTPTIRQPDSPATQQRALLPSRLPPASCVAPKSPFAKARRI